MIGRRMVLGGLAASAGAAGAWAQASAFNGTWNGTLDAGGTKLRLRLVINADDSAMLYSLDQGAQPIPAKVVGRGNDYVVVDVPVINARYTAVLEKGRLVGTFTQGGDLPLEMERGEAVAALVPPPAAPAPAAEPPAEPLTDALLQQWRKAAGIPAMAAAAEKGGQRRFWADGDRVTGLPMPVSTEDLWHVGSITKSMTATLVGRLVEAGRFAWTDTVSGVLGALPGMRPEYAQATFRHLLSHTSGLPGNIAMQNLMAFSREIDDARAERRKWAEMALAMAPVGEMARKFEYSNNGYIVAGAMLEARMGESWEQLIRKHLFDPLGLKTAGFGAPGTEGQVDQPSGHAAGPSGLIAMIKGDGPTDNPAALGPAGRVHMSQADMLTYLAAHRDRSGLLKAETWDVLHKPPFGGPYAMGWVVRPDGSLWHNGSNTMWYAEAAFSPTAGWAATAAANDGRQPSHPVVGRTLKSAAAAV